MMHRVAYGNWHPVLALPPCPVGHPLVLLCRLCSSGDASNPSDDDKSNTEKTHQAVKRIASKAATIARNEQFYRYIQQGLGALQAHQRAEGDFKGLLDQFTRMASEQSNRANASQSTPSFGGAKHLEELAQQCKMTITMAIKKDFADTYSGASEQFQRQFVERRAQQKLDQQQSIKSSSSYQPIFANSAKPSADFRPIFEGPLDRLTARPLRFWREWDERRSRILGQALGPTNAWEEQIQWTEQGKMWPYPIDNALLSGEEENTSFVDHVFLETELAKYKLPRTGPVAHFMELVVNGLSRNPFMSVKKKREHLEWYAGYFTDALKGNYKELLQSD